MNGQGEAHRLVRISRRMTICAASLGLALTFGLAAHAAERVTPSGLPVPRYVSLKFDKVNARSGPGDDHKLLWVYQVRGLPMQVVAETSEWRRICDPEGGRVWVHRRTTDGRRTVMNTRKGPVALFHKPKPDAQAVAFLNPRALATLVRCDQGWCRVRVDGVTGWTREGELWGTAEAPQCR